MNWNNFASCLMLLCFVISCNEPTNESKNESTRVTGTKYLIDAEVLFPIAAHDTIVLLDLQHPEDYLKGHLPNAINLWRSELNNPLFKYDGMMPERDYLEEILQRRGIPSNAFLVLYDNRGSCEATRLWWILKHYGYERMAILNGGTQDWLLVDTLTKNVTINRMSGNFRFPENIKASSSDDILVNDLSEKINQDRLIILDTRSKEEHEGLTLKKGARWAGSIPGSIHIDWMEAVDQTTSRFKGIEDLQNIYKEVLNDDRLAVTYCHSGVRSTHTFFVLTELLGRKNVKNYDGSWVEWTHHFQPESVNK